ncbi:hypothetical protein LCGC14_2553910, partial [marine sediment metagenome]
DGLLNEVQTAEVKRTFLTWGANNEPDSYEIAQVWSQPTVTRAATFPYPPRHDQQKYIVAEGDIVCVVSGRDGRHFIFSDELPFVGAVMSAIDVTDTRDDPPANPSTNDAYLVGTGTGDWSGQDGKIATWDGAQWVFTTVAAEISVKEDNTGGAGLLYLRVRRQAMTEDPTSQIATLADLLAATGETVEYNYVNVIGPTSQAHGYRVGDKVWVKRRGLYFYVVPARESFPAYLVNGGPDGENDFNDNNYWVREFDAAITYAANQWSTTNTDRTQTDSSGGRLGRWVHAINDGELSGTHHLNVVNAGNPSGGTLVVVTMFADPADGEPWYEFSLAPEYKGDAVWVGAEPGDVKQAAFLSDGSGNRIVAHLKWDSGVTTKVGPWYAISDAQGNVAIGSRGTHSFKITPWKDEYDGKKHSRVLQEGAATYVNFTFPPDIYVDEVNDGVTTVSSVDKITFVDGTDIDVVVTAGAANEAIVTISST